MQIGFSTVKYQPVPATKQIASNDATFSLQEDVAGNKSGSAFEFPPASADHTVKLAWKQALASLPSDRQLMAHATVLTSIHAGNPDHAGLTKFDAVGPFETTLPETVADWKTFTDRWIGFYNESVKQFPEYDEPLNFLRQFRSHLG